MNNKETALLVIDVQNGMFDEGVYQGNKLLENLKNLISKAREANVPVIYVQHNEEEGLVFGSTAWEVHPVIAPLPGDTSVYKETPDSFYKTNLEEVLKEKGIKNLVITGIQSEVCVDTTTRRAFSLGYDLTLIIDAHGTFDNPVLSAQQIIDHENCTLRWFADQKTTEEMTF